MPAAPTVDNPGDDQKDFPGKARNAQTRCLHTAGEGSSCRGTRCLLFRGHLGAHLYGTAEYERQALRDAGHVRIVNGLEIFYWPENRPRPIEPTKETKRVSKTPAKVRNPTSSSLFLGLPMEKRHPVN